MNQRDYQYCDKVMGHYAALVRDGFSLPGIYKTSHWPDGKPGDSRHHTGSNRHKRLIPYTQPKETRTTVYRLPCMRPIDSELVDIHRAVMRLPADYQEFITLAWVRRYTNARDLSIILGMPSRQIRHWKVKVFDSVPIKL